MKPPILKNITLDGYKSIRHMSLDLRPLNVLIGPNGAGKSNLVSFFRLLHEMSAEKLQEFIGISGGAHTLLHYGPGTTEAVETSLRFGEGNADYTYRNRLAYAAVDTLLFTNEELLETAGRGTPEPMTIYEPVQRETHIAAKARADDYRARALRELLDALGVFQFHNTSQTSCMRQSVYIHDNRTLRQDGGNLAAVLFKLKQTNEQAYRRILLTIQQMAPWFDDFVLEPSKLNENNILLNWRERDSHELFGPHQLSDGSLRAMALVTLLLQPRDDLPPLVVVDEPELGLHPFAMVILAALVREAAFHCQLVLATQSTHLLDQFDPEDVIVVDRRNGESTFRRLEPDELREWLEDYSLSELWEKNVIGGGPA